MNAHVLVFMYEHMYEHMCAQMLVPCIQDICACTMHIVYLDMQSPQEVLKCVHQSLHSSYSMEGHR